MISIETKDTEVYRNLGLPRDVTLDEVVSRLATVLPEQLAIADDASRDKLMERPVRSYTYAGLELRVQCLAATIRTWNLRTGSIIAVMLPNITEAIITNLAIWRAGHVAAQVPFYWGKREVMSNLADLQPSAFICLTQFAQRHLLKEICCVAEELPSVRVVASVCASVDDHAAVSIAGCFSEQEEAPGGPGPLNSTERSEAGNNSDQLAVITFDETVPCGSKGVAVFRTHHHLMATAVPIIISAQIRLHQVLATNYCQSGLFGLAGAWVSAVLTGSLLQLSLFRSLKDHARVLVDSNADIAFIPANFVDAVAGWCAPKSKNLRFVIKNSANMDPFHLSDVIDEGGSPVNDKTSKAGFAFTNVLGLGEAALLVDYGPEESTGLLNAGRVCAINKKNGARLCYADIKLVNDYMTGAKVVAVRSTGLPVTDVWQSEVSDVRRFAITPDGYSVTHFRVQEVSSCGTQFHLCPEFEDILSYGRAAVDLNELDDLLGMMPGVEDAMAFQKSTGMQTVIGVAIVQQKTAQLELADIQRYLMDKGLSYFKLPVGLTRVSYIRRDHRSRPLRYLLSGKKDSREVQGKLLAPSGEPVRRAG